MERSRRRSAMSGVASAGACRHPVLAIRALRLAGSWHQAGRDLVAMSTQDLPQRACTGRVRADTHAPTLADDQSPNGHSVNTMPSISSMRIVRTPARHLTCADGTAPSLSVP